MRLFQTTLEPRELLNDLPPEPGLVTVIGEPGRLYAHDIDLGSTGETPEPVLAPDHASLLHRALDIYDSLNHPPSDSQLFGELPSDPLPSGHVDAIIPTDQMSIEDLIFAGMVRVLRNPDDQIKQPSDQIPHGPLSEDLFELRREDDRRLQAFLDLDHQAHDGHSSPLQIPDDFPKPMSQDTRDNHIITQDSKQALAASDAEHQHDNSVITQQVHDAQDRYDNAMTAADVSLVLSTVGSAAHISGDAATSSSADDSRGGSTLPHFELLPPADFGHHWPF
jgi:hypothetical protein